MAHPLISQAIVVVKEISTMDKRLVAYLLFEAGQLVSNQEVRKYLRDFLPEYMIPQLLVEIESFPLTPNGKVDRKRLPDPIDDISNTDQFFAPETKTEREMAAIWSQQLGVKEISVSDHFYDIGGHSLLATLAIHEVESHFNISISAADMFSYSLEQLADRVDKKIVLLNNRKKNKNKSPAKWMQKIKKSLLGDRV
jgi:acyl carrier protein